MVKDLELLECFYCGKAYHLNKYSQKKSMICSGCGMETVPLITGKTEARDEKEFYILLSYFVISALLGALGGVMLMNGWNFWVTFAMVGGIVYLMGKIFVGKYKISVISEYVSVNKIPGNQSTGHQTVFDRLVVDAIEELPQSLKGRLSNVSIIVEDKPNNEILEKMELKSDRTLLGLFQGVPLNKRSVWQSGTMPERITIFQKNIETLCHSEEEIKQRIKEVIRHEVAHFVGFTEEEIRKLGY